jgi:hypothetical protein
MQPLQGVIHGKTIELRDDPGLPEGTAVEVLLAANSTSQQMLEALGRCAGALADDWTSVDDEILAGLQADRKNSSR